MDFSILLLKTILGISYYLLLPHKLQVLSFSTTDVLSHEISAEICRFTASPDPWLRLTSWLLEYETSRLAFSLVTFSDNKTVHIYIHHSFFIYSENLLHLLREAFIYSEKLCERPFVLGTAFCFYWFLTGLIPMKTHLSNKRHS